MNDKYGFTIHLIDKNYKNCPICTSRLSIKYVCFYVTQKDNKRKAIIEEVLLYCGSCNKYYISKEMYKEFKKKHPKYYISYLRGITKKKKVEKKKTVEEKKTVTKFEPYVMEKVNNNAKLFISNMSSVKNKVCPKCHSVLMYANMNVPIYLSNGDFYRHYVERVVFCLRCNQGYIDVDDVSNLLNRIERRANKKCELRFNNVNVKHSERDDSYLLLPTLDNDIIVYNPPKEQRDNLRDNQGIIEKSNLNSTSFLYDMGYNIKKDDIERQRILYNAVLQYGKRKVADHLSFLIYTRLNQENGANKYKNAINIWQQDKNYVVSIRQGGRVG